MSRDGRYAAGAGMRRSGDASELAICVILGMAETDIWLTEFSERHDNVSNPGIFWASLMLVLVGTLFGKHTYFKKRVIKMWSRVIPKGVHRHSRRY